MIGMKKAKPTGEIKLKNDQYSVLKRYKVSEQTKQLKRELEILTKNKDQFPFD
jgi:hypothetical protein